MISRRDFMKYTSAGIVGASLFGPTIFSAHAGELLSGKNRRVVVIGGGFGGATAAHYLKQYNPKLEVVLIEQAPKFISCPSSNLVLSGLRTLPELTFGYGALAKIGIKVIHDTVTAIDPAANRVSTAKGFIRYDRLIVSPGISFNYGSIEGMDAHAQALFPHAWKAGEQTLQLRKELLALKKGGVFLMTIPEAPFRCPPGPYERACQVANYLKKTKNGGKVIVLDANPDVVSKGKLFKAAWKDYYQDIIDYRPDVTVKEVIAGTRSIVTDAGEIKGDILNIIPPQQAGKLAFDTGLVPQGKIWAPTTTLTFESTVHKNIHIIGDATDPGSIGSLPKSGFVANTMGKAVAAAVVALMDGTEPPEPSLGNSCYSQVNDTESIYITGVFAYDREKKKMVGIKAAGNPSPDRSARYTAHYHDWEKSIIRDTLGG